MEGHEPVSNSVKLSAAQKARMERNRLKALTLKESKLIPRPTAKIEACVDVVRIGTGPKGTTYRDTGGGFLLEEEDEIPLAPVVKNQPAPLVHASEQPVCLECSERFAESYLFDTFHYNVCDKCRDNEDKHTLITRTEAKSEYLLKDCDLDSRPPPLAYIVRKNPHNPRWGSMKLYLHVQVEERALEVWGSEEALLAEQERRNERKERAKATSYKRGLRELRMRVRSSLYDRTTAAPEEHVHKYEETCLGDDSYRGVCTLCGHTAYYEKM